MHLGKQQKMAQVLGLCTHMGGQEECFGFSLVHRDHCGHLESEAAKEDISLFQSVTLASNEKGKF